MMKQLEVPNRDRWVGWVSFAWTLAVVVCIAGFFLISEFGFIEVPSSTRYVTYSEPNITVWAMAIGQAIGSIMLAVVFSMLNSIYQNTCDQRSDARKAFLCDSPDAATPAKQGEVLRLTGVSENSPLRGGLAPGCVIQKINGDWAGSVAWAQSLVVKGPNKFEYINESKQNETKWIHLKPGQPLLIEGETEIIPSEPI